MVVLGRESKRPEHDRDYIRPLDEVRRVKFPVKYLDEFDVEAKRSEHLLRAIKIDKDFEHLHGGPAEDAAGGHRILIFIGRK